MLKSIRVEFSDGNTRTHNDSIEIIKFPAGESAVKIDDVSQYLMIDIENTSAKNICLSVNYDGDMDFIMLLQLTDLIRQLNSSIKINLNIPYLPHSRMDRKMDEYTCFSLKSMCKILDLCKFNSIKTNDIHSPVAEAILDNLVNISQADTFHEWADDDVRIENPCILVAPDAGAAKKIYDFSGDLTVKDVIIANKVRDLKTGEIVKTEIPDYNAKPGETFWIIDDICDGGRTFIELAKVMREKYGKEITINLYTTHGFYSKGKEVILDVIDNIYCAFDFSQQNKQDMT